MPAAAGRTGAGARGPAPDGVNHILAISAYFTPDCPTFRGAVAAKGAGNMTSRNEDQHNGRRSGVDRRQQQVPIAFPDRRKGDRRGGADRRAAPRS